MGPKQLHAIERLNVILAGIAILASALFAERPVALGITVGALLSCVNFFGIHRIWSSSMAARASKRAVLQILLMAKMVGFMVAIFVAMKFLPLSAPALAVGLSTFLVAIAIESFRFALGGSGENEGGTDTANGDPGKPGR